MAAPDTNENSVANSAALNRAVASLRESVPVREEWRAEVLRDVAAEPIPSRLLPASFLPEVRGRTPAWRRSFAVQPIAAVAACVIAMVIGGVGTFALVRAAQSPNTPVSTASASVHASANGATPAIAQLPENTPTVPVANPADTRKIIRFALVAPHASHVSIVGDFNNWNAGATPLTATRDGGTWIIDMPLSAGRHVYAFVVDGDLVADPSALRAVDHDFGVQNSVVLVGSL